MRTITVINKSLGTQISDHVECADGSLTRLVGLLGRTGLEAGAGLLIQPSSGIHTVGMKFTIDAVGLDANLCVVKLWPQMRPNRISSVHLTVRSVLELAAGEIEKRSIEVGHMLDFIPNDRPAPQRAWSASPFSSPLGILGPGGVLAPR
jgi:uncharacterized membrane protein (UPF0127 family)